MIGSVFVVTRGSLSLAESKRYTVLHSGDSATFIDPHGDYPAATLAHEMKHAEACQDSAGMSKFGSSPFSDDKDNPDDLPNSPGYAFQQKVMAECNSTMYSDPSSCNCTPPYPPPPPPPPLQNLYH